MCWVQWNLVYLLSERQPCAWIDDLLPDIRRLSSQPMISSFNSNNVAQVHTRAQTKVKYCWNSHTVSNCCFWTLTELSDWVGFNVPLSTLQVISGTGFLRVKWPNQQCQSTERSNGPKDQASIPPGPPHHVTILHMHTTSSQTQNNTYTKINLSTVKWAHWDKTQSTELLVLFIWVCSSLCTIVAHNTAQNRPDNFPSCPPDNHHCSGDVYLMERGLTELSEIFRWHNRTELIYKEYFNHFIQKLHLNR